VEMLAKLADTSDVELWGFYDFGQPSTIKEFRETVWKVTQGANKGQLHSALKVFPAGGAVAESLRTMPRPSKSCRFSN
jgi:hypothetical protein